MANLHEGNLCAQKAGPDYAAKWDYNHYSEFYAITTLRQIDLFSNTQPANVLFRILLTFSVDVLQSQPSGK